MNRRKPRPPLNPETLNELALRYVGRFATTRMKLTRYLRNKVRERGWEGGDEPQVDQIVERCARNGYVDDAAFALTKAVSLTARGYGAGRVRQSLRASGVGDDDSRTARQLADDEAVDAALKMAKRKRIGPFSSSVPERDAREKAIAALVRAGHGFPLARAIVGLNPGVEPDIDQLTAIARRSDG